MPLDKVTVLRQAPLFSGLDDDDLLSLAEQSQVDMYDAGMILFHQHDPGGTLYIVEAGEVELYVRDKTGMEVRLLKVGAGQVFGEMSLLDNLPRSASARALTAVTVLLVTKAALINVTTMRPSVAMHLLEMLAGRLRSTSVMVQERVVPHATDIIDVKLRWADRISDFFTSASGNIYFVLFSLVWFVVWIVWNMGIIPGLRPFDPFPFGLLTMVVSLEMVFLSLFILIKQARQAANDKVRDDIEYEVNVRAELGVRNLGNQLEALERRMTQRFDQLEQRSRSAIPQQIDR